MSYAVNVVKILNPFDPFKGHERTKYVVDRETSLATVLGFKPEDYVVSVSGRVVPGSDWGRTYLAETDSVVLCPVVQGGGGGKGILRVIAMIAVIAFAPQMAAIMTGEFGVLAGANMLLVKAGIVVLGGMLVNALLPPPKAKKEDDAESPSYGIDGAKNTSAEGLVVPVLYGTHRYGGNIINNYLVNDGDSQWLHMLINCGEGPIDSFSGIELNDEPISAYYGIEVDSRLGYADQSVIPWFANTTTPQSVSSRLSPDWTYRTTSSAVDSVRLDFAWPNGLYYANDDGGTDPEYTNIEIQYSLAGANNWQWLPGATATPGRMGVRQKKKSAVRLSYYSFALPQGVYDIRVRRDAAERFLTDEHVVDTAFWSDLNEIVAEPVAYTNTALLAIRLKLNAQISSVPRVTHIQKGRLVRVWNKTTGQWEFKHSANPAWITLDIFTNKRIGAKFPISRFDLAKWKEWADYCDSNGLEFNGFFDTASNIWDASQTVFRAGHAQPIRVGTRYSVAIERAEDPVMTFSVANMLKGTFKETWLPLSERVNEIEASYYDKDDNYAQHTLRVYDKNSVTAGVPQRSTSLDLKGVTSRAQAWKDLNTMLNINRYIQRTVEFGAPIDAVACTVGNVVLVQHDMPQWGFAGRLEAGNTSTLLKLDREVTFEYGKTYSALVHHSALRRYTGTVSSVASLNAVNATTSIVLSDFDNLQKVARCVINGKDYRVSAIFQINSVTWGVTLDTTDSILSGAAYELWDTDVLETCPIVNVATALTPSVTVTQITASTPYSDTPALYTSWMFGETTKVAKPFRIKSISGSHEYRRDIVAIEYNASVYADSGAVPTPNYSSLDGVIKHCSIDGVSEAISSYGTTYKSQVTVSFSSTQQIFKRGNVYVSRDGVPFEFVGSDPYAVTVDAIPGEVLIFKVLAEDIFGKVVADVNSPTLTYTVLGMTQTPDAVQNLTFVAGDAGWVFNFDPPTESGWTATQARVGPSWVAGEPIFNAKATSFVWPWQSQGTYSVRFRHVLHDTLFSSTDAVATVIVQNPVVPTISGVDQSAGSALVRWADARTSQPVKHYIVKLGPNTADWTSAVEVARASGTATSQSLAIATNGFKKVFVQAVDMAGNVSPVSSYDFEVSTGETIDMTPPPALSSFTATAGFSVAIIEWVEPTYTEGGGPGGMHIYGANWAEGDTRPLFASAKLVGSVPAGVNLFTDSIGLSKRRVYWLKNVTSAGVEQTAPTGGTDGIAVTTTKIGSTDLGDLVVQAGNLANNAVTAVKITDNAITAAKLAANSIAVGTAAIQDGAIVNAMIANATIDNAKIANLDAAKISTGTLAAGRIAANSITADKLDTRSLTIKDASGTVIFGAGTLLDGGTYIQDGTISSAKIANTIQSTNYVANTSGWKINKAGGIEANDITARGTIYASAGTFAGSLSAATGTFSGTLTASAINAVNTINLAGQAVTIPVYSWNPNDVFFGGSETEVVAITINSTGAPILVLAGCYCYTNDWTSYPASVGASLYRDGIQIAVTMSMQSASSLNLPPVIDTPGVGAHRYSLRVINGNYAYMNMYSRQNGLACIEMKR